MESQSRNVLSPSWDNQKSKPLSASILDISRHQQTPQLLAAGLIGIIMSQFFLLSLPPHTSPSSQTPEWLTAFCFIAHQTGLVLSACPHWTKGTQHLQRRGWTGGMHTSQGDTWEIGADVTEAGTAGRGRATGRHVSTGWERKTEGRRLCPITLTPPPPPPTEDGGLHAVWCPSLILILFSSLLLPPSAPFDNTIS